MSQPIGFYVSGDIPQSLEDSIAASNEKQTIPMYMDLFEGAEDISIPPAFNQEDTAWVYALEGERKREFLLYLANLFHGN